MWRGFMSSFVMNATEMESAFKKYILSLISTCSRESSVPECLPGPQGEKDDGLYVHMFIYHCHILGIDKYCSPNHHLQIYSRQTTWFADTVRSPDLGQYQDLDKLHRPVCHNISHWSIPWQPWLSHSPSHHGTVQRNFSLDCFFFDGDFDSQRSSCLQI